MREHRRPNETRGKYALQFSQTQAAACQQNRSPLQQLLRRLVGKLFRRFGIDKNWERRRVHKTPGLPQRIACSRC